MGVAPILVVDDEPDMRSALTHSIQRSGFEVESAASGSEAVVKFKKNTYSLVVTDVKMPEMSGIDFIREIKQISPKHREKNHMGDTIFWVIATVALIVGFRWLQKRKK